MCASLTLRVNFRIRKKKPDVGRGDIERDRERDRDIWRPLTGELPKSDEAVENGDNERLRLRRRLESVRINNSKLSACCTFDWFGWSPLYSPQVTLLPHQYIIDVLLSSSN